MMSPSSGIPGNKNLRQHFLLLNKVICLKLVDKRVDGLNLLDDVVEVCEVSLKLLDGLAEQPPVRLHAHVRHPVNGHQSLHQPAQRVEGGLTSLGAPKLNV